MRKVHKDTLDRFGVEVVGVETRTGRNDALAYFVLKDGQTYRWAVSSVDRGVPPWEYTKKKSKRYKYGAHPYVYRMFSDSGDLLYIGKTTQLDYRMYAHFYKYREDWKDQVARIDAHRFTKEADMHIYEMYLVTKYKPVFNREASCTDYPSMELPELEFSEVTDWE